QSSLIYTDFLLGTVQNTIEIISVISFTHWCVSNL
ncbi:hypothetical protein GWI33_003122, partial [Rhynchophorus ferrugineus]